MKMTKSYFYCQECNQEMPLPRYGSYQRGKGHVKNLYCIRCKKETKFSEVSERMFRKNGIGEYLV